MKIQTARDMFLVKKAGGYKAWVNRLFRDKWGFVPNWTVGKAPPVRAYINRSCWVADCECRGCMVVEPNEPYLCPDCGNAMYRGQPREVIFPKNREQIEAVLLKRPYPKNRNWLLTETLADLKRQNKENGDEV